MVFNNGSITHVSPVSSTPPISMSLGCTISPANQDNVKDQRPIYAIKSQVPNKKVGKKKFPYTKSGMARAKKAAKKSGKKMKKRSY